MAKAHNHAALVMQMYHISHGHVRGGQTMLKTALYSASLCGSMEAPAAAVTHTCRGLQRDYYRLLYARPCRQNTQHFIKGLYVATATIPMATASSCTFTSCIYRITGLARQKWQPTKCGRGIH